MNTTKVNFYNADVFCRLEKKTELKTFVESIFNQESILFESLNFIFCSDEYLLDINRSFLQHDYYTDIITFDLSETKDNSVVGEIYISIDRVKENASSIDVPFKEELLRIIFHGVLHLCGYKDKSKLDIKEMRTKEDFYLSLFHNQG